MENKLVYKIKHYKEKLKMDLDILIDSKQSELEIAKGVDMETYYKIKKELEELLAKQKGGA